MAGPTPNGRIHSTEKPMFYINRWGDWTYNLLNDPVEVTRAKRRRLDAEAEQEELENDDRPDPAAIIDALFPSHAQVPAIELHGGFDDDCSDCEMSAPNEGPDDMFAPVHLDPDDDEEDREPCDCLPCSFMREGNFELRHVTEINRDIFDGSLHEYMEEHETGTLRLAAGEESDDDVDDEELENGEVRETAQEAREAVIHQDMIDIILAADSAWLGDYADKLRESMERGEEQMFVDRETSETLLSIAERAQQIDETGTCNLSPALVNWALGILREHGQI